MEKVYIKGVGSISAQKTFEDDFLETITEYNQAVFPTIDPDYKKYIPPAAARRMSKGIKMGIAATKIALEDAKIESLDAIITGTGMGCVIDSEKFLDSLIENEEQYLTPTSFIQSTHNTVAGQIALALATKVYNFTYVHSAISFESALLDAQSQLENDEANNILVGGVDELGERTVKFHKLINHIKEEDIPTSNILKSKTKGTIFSEGANFFVLSNKINSESYAELCDLQTYNSLPKENLTEIVTEFLKKNNLKINDLDFVILGNNGDVEFDSYYSELSEGILKNTQQVAYKHLSGEFNTASGFGFWLASKILKTQSIPEITKLNKIESSNLKTGLIYNQYRGENHSLILLKKC